MFHKEFNICSLILLCVSGSLFASEKSLQIHVSPQGDDGNPGTKAKPLANLSAVSKKLAQLHKDGIDKHINVILHKGIYRLGKPFVLGPEHLPSDGHSMTFTAVKGAKPIISGGRLIEGWKKNTNGTFSTHVNWQFRELFINDARRPRARHPNKGYHRIVKASKDRRTGFTFRPGDIPKKLSQGAELVFLHDWSTSRVPVKSIDIDDNQLTVAYPIGCKAAHYRIDHFEKHPRYYLENDLALLDQPGEWHLDQKTRVLTYYPFPEEKPETLKATAPFASQLLIVRGTEKHPVRNVHFRGIQFSHASWHLPPGGYASGQASVHEYRDFSRRHSSRKIMEAAVLFELAEHCSLRNCDVKHLGSSGVWFGSRTKNCHIEGNLFEDISANSLNLGEDSSRRVQGQTWWKQAPQQIASGHVVANNLFQEGGQQFFGSVAIWGGIVHQMHIHHNVIRRQPYTGISLGWMWNPQPTPAGKHIVEHNHIHHVMQILSDGGGIYTLGRQPDSVFRENHIHDIPLNAGRAQSNGMFLDQGSSEFRIAKNLIYNIARSPLRFHQAKDILVEKNVLVVSEKNAPAYTYNRTDPKTIERNNNLVVQSIPAELDLVESIRQEAGIEDKYRKRFGLK